MVVRMNTLKSSRSGRLDEMIPIQALTDFLRADQFIGTTVPLWSDGPV